MRATLPFNGLTKSAILVCFNCLAEHMYSPSNVEVIDGAVIFKMNPPTTSNTHGKYCDMELKANVLRITDSLQRVDIVFETYQRNDDSKTKFFQMISSSLSKISCSTQIVRTKI